MDLASVWNVYENNFITALFWPQEGVSPFEDMWIGLYYDYVSSKQWKLPPSCNTL